MLRELSVQNLATIEDVRVELDQGYCAWTGETGAGKSLLLTALNLVLGGKAAADLVRSGKEEARAAAVFELDDALRAEVESVLGGPLDEENLILTRRISSQGRSQAHANGLPVPVATLKALGARLVDIHGQHEGRVLMEPERQRALLDAFGGNDGLLASYQRGRDAYDELRRRREALVEAAERRRREQALLAFERDDLASAEPRAGEYDELAAEALRLASVEAVREATAQGVRLLYEADGSAQEIISGVARKLDALSTIPELSEAAQTLERLAEEVREVAYNLRELGRDSEDDPERLDTIETRLALYRRLASRFHCKPDELAERLAEIERQLAAIERDDADLAGLDAPLAEAWDALKIAAEALTVARKKTCKSFAKAVQSQFKALSLEQARLTAEVETTPLDDEPGGPPPPEDGPDRIEMLFAPNPGEGPRPLRKIASGGELSRVTLAVKVVLAEVDRVSTVVLDEIDVGVGGRLGAALGRKLAELGKHRQVVCITHLPQMASFAARQWLIHKKTEKGRTKTTITPLAEEERVDELAAMIRGESAAEGTRQEALAMLAEARALR